MFDIVLLRSLVAVADSGGFTRAAGELNLTQSAVSAHIRRLEAEVGHKLLERTTRSVALTPAGARLAGYARSILALTADARASLGLGRPLAGAVRIGISEGMAKAPLTDCLRQFRAAHGGVGITLQFGLTADLLAQIDAGKLDVVLGSRCGGDDRGEVFWSEPLVWAASRAFPPALAPVPLIVYPESCPYRAAAVEALAHTGRDWRIACQSPSLDGLLMAADAGLGVVPMTRSACHRAGLGEVEALPVLPGADFVFIAGSRSNPAIKALAQEMRRCVLGMLAHDR